MHGKPADPLAELARRYVWWQPAETTLARDLPKLLTQVLSLGTPEVYHRAVAVWGEAALRQALDEAEPGAVDDRSWHFWRQRFGLPERPPPRRLADGSASMASDRVLAGSVACPSCETATTRPSEDEDRDSTPSSS